MIWGNVTVNVVPCPGTDIASIAPLRASMTILCTLAKPNPVPSWMCPVVKNGSKILERYSGKIPCPKSRTVIAKQGVARSLSAAIISSTRPRFLRIGVAFNVRQQVQYYLGQVARIPCPCLVTPCVCCLYVNPQGRSLFCFKSFSNRTSSSVVSSSLKLGNLDVVLKIFWSFDIRN